MTVPQRLFASELNTLTVHAYDFYQEFLFMILASGLGDTPGNICNTHPGEDDTKNVMWCYKLNNYCPGIWWETLLMLSANILISIQGHAVKNSAYSKDILCTPSWDLFPVMRVKIYYRFTCLYS